MRKKAEIASCDFAGCKNYVELSETRHGFNPPGWFRIQVVAESGQIDSHTFEFCSPKCVKKWAEERIKVIPAQGNHPCGFCDFVSSTIQGLRMHERNAHGINVKNQ